MQLEKLVIKVSIKMFDLKINTNEIDKIGKFTKEEKKFRVTKFKLF